MFPPVGNGLNFQLAAELPNESLHSLGFKCSPIIPNNLVAPDGMVFRLSSRKPKCMEIKDLRYSASMCLFSRQA